VPDAIFAHPRLTPVYDAFDGPRDDLPAYAGMADELGAHRVLDAGCGTGSLALLLAGTGRDVIGADPAAASLEVAKSKDTSAAVTWVHTAVRHAGHGRNGPLTPAPSPVTSQAAAGSSGAGRSSP
jgi:SAM-dependent methyltransferase